MLYISLVHSFIAQYYPVVRIYVVYVMNTDAINIHVHIFVWIYVFIFMDEYQEIELLGWRIGTY